MHDTRRGRIRRLIYQIVKGCNPRCRFHDDAGAGGMNTRLICRRALRSVAHFSRTHFAPRTLTRSNQNIRNSMRPSKRKPDELRRVSIERAVSVHAEGSCLIKFGNTQVLCMASIEERVPPWLKGQGRGWVTAEYGMLPRATKERTRREVTTGHPSGRTQEIQRLIGRSLRAIVDLQKLGEKQISVDCDVIQADGGTRTAAITGAWVALHDCIAWMRARDMVKDGVLRDQVAAVSAGLYAGEAVLDLDYAEDSEADTDANFVMTGGGGIVEIQGTAETVPFSQDDFDKLTGLARKGIGELISLQKLTVA